MSAELPDFCHFCRRPLHCNNRSGVCSECHRSGLARCRTCGAKCSRSRGLCPSCLPKKPDGTLGLPQAAGHAGRILFYARRAALGLPLFEGARDLTVD